MIMPMEGNCLILFFVTLHVPFDACTIRLQYSIMLAGLVLRFVALVCRAEYLIVVLSLFRLKEKCL